MKKTVKNKITSAKDPKSGSVRLTTPDLVILSLLAERPMHGYEVNVTLETRNIRDWAAVSRPQVYYSLDKLTGLGLLYVIEKESPAAGPERRVLKTTESGRRHLAEALEDARWTNTPVHQPFLTWLALSWQAKPLAFQKQLKRRQNFLKKKLAEEESTLKDILAEVGHPYHEAVWMLKLMIGQIELELKWLNELSGESARRGPARKRTDRKRA